MKKLAYTIGIMALPVVTFAQQDGDLTTFENMAESIGTIVNTLIPVAFGLAVLFFFYGLATYILSKDQDNAVAKKRMLWGVIAIFVMAAIWGLVRFISNAFGIDDTNTGVSPTIDLPDVTGGSTP